MKAQDCEFFTHPPTSEKYHNPHRIGEMDVKCRQIKTKMERATIWVMQPKSHKVGKLFHRYPFSAKEKCVASESMDFVKLSFVICFAVMSMFSAVMFLNDQLASTYPGLYININMLRLCLLTW